VKNPIKNPIKEPTPPTRKPIPKPTSYPSSPVSINNPFNLDNNPVIPTYYPSFIKVST